MNVNVTRIDANPYLPRSCTCSHSMHGMNVQLHGGSDSSEHRARSHKKTENTCKEHHQHYARLKLVNCVKCKALIRLINCCCSTVTKTATTHKKLYNIVCFLQLLPLEP